MDFPSPEPVVQALQNRVEHGVFGYPIYLTGKQDEVSGFRRLIIKRMAQLYNWDVEPQDILFLPGVVTGFRLACHTLAVPDGGVLIQTPVYPPILKAADTTGAVPQEMELTYKQDGSYGVDWDAFEASIDSRTRLFILCNPHNPVSKVFQKNELERMAEICLQNEVVICSDEIHCDFIFKGYRHYPIAAIDPEIAQNTITLMAPSKTFNIAGLQCSFAIIQNGELREQFLGAQKGLVTWVNMMGMLAGEVAYREGGEWLEQLMVYLEANRDFLTNYIEAEMPEIQIRKVEGTYLAWLDCRQLEINTSPCEFFIQKGRVAFNDGATFGPGGEGFVRFNFGCPRSMLEEALQRMKLAIKS